MLLASCLYSSLMAFTFLVPAIASYKARRREEQHLRARTQNAEMGLEVTCVQLAVFWLLWVGI